MLVKCVFYTDPVTEDETVTVGYVLEKEDHIIIINDLHGEGGEGNSFTVIPLSCIVSIEHPKVEFRLIKGGKDGQS